MSSVDGYGRGGPLILDDAFHVDEDGTTGTAGATKFAVATKIITDADIRCQGQIPLANGTHKVCNKLLAKLASRPWQIQCGRCHADNTSPAA